MTHPILQQHLWGIAANASHWFVTTLKQIHKFDIATGEHVCSFGATGTAVGQCSALRGIALYGTELFVVDVNRQRVIVFKSDDGAFVHEFGDDKQLSDPLNVTVNAAHVFVSDDWKRVVVFDRVDGRCVRSVDIKMYDAALVCTHTFLAVCGYDDLVCGFDATSSIVRVFDATSGTRLDMFSSEGSGFAGMTIVGDRLWIVDHVNHRIQIVA
jgi:hypothetical protein